MCPRRRYPSDLTDEQWTLVEPVFSAPRLSGRREMHPRRDVVNAILYRASTGCSWRQLPKEFPPWETVYWHFRRWRDDSSLDALMKVLEGREPEAGERPPATDRSGRQPFSNITFACRAKFFLR
jgi:transposase